MTTPLRCAVIEDEPLAQKLLEKYIRRVSLLELVATFDDAVAAFETLPTLRPDVLFLDINLPEMSGIEFLRAYPVPHPIVVMTTANPHHALDGFDFGVTDYLLKPIAFDRFLKAVGRLLSLADGGQSSPATTATNSDSAADTANFVYLKTDKKLEQIHLRNIIFVQALGDYLKVFLADRYLVTHLTMNRLAEILPADQFLRINRSYIVQQRCIKTLNGNSIITSTGHNLSIGPNYREVVKERIRQSLVE